MRIVRVSNDSPDFGKIGLRIVRKTHDFPKVTRPSGENESCSSACMIFHWVIGTRYRAQPFLDRDACVEMWETLKKVFPQALSAVIMPDHIHCIHPALDQEFQERSRISRAFLGVAKRWEFKFEAPLPPREILDSKHLLRQIRYVHLNPCRSQLCADPLEWEWSTHWDVMGLIKDPWIPAQRIFKTINRKEDLAWFHRYVSSDPSVRVEGTAPPLRLKAGRQISIDDLAMAVAAVHRSSPQAFFRKQGLRRELIQSAFALKAGTSAQIAHWLGITAQNVRANLGEQVDLKWLEPIHILTHDVRTLKVLLKVGESFEKRTILPSSMFKM